ncbi:histone deacetylase 14, chloroplastic-like [Rutidosis leptorrhynchoides]|uniref:histone deacetylase 14, chloroplastic-like n=1 Tax=Rutidosis leptorrhynchoides TaxID=125765 RepID=UPI003A9A540B
MVQSYEDSFVAAGAGLSLVDFVVEASKINKISPVGFALMPPPIHHVCVMGSMEGCCYFENAGIAARYAQRVYGLKRVLIIDFDVHFLYTTNDAFYDDPDIFGLSTHCVTCYRKYNETGSKRGKGATLNLPLPDGSGDIAMRNVFDEVIVPCGQKFKPDIIIVSAGFDGHAVDPTANLELTTRTYFMLASGIKQLAKDLCDGRCVFFLEGGQSESIVSFSVAEYFRAFLGEPCMAPEFEKKYAVFLYDEPSSKIKKAIQKTKKLHSL